MTVMMIRLERRIIAGDLYEYRINDIPVSETSFKAVIQALRESGAFAVVP